VDWAGSESLGVDPDTGVLDKYHVLIALMLSSQTKDQVVAEAMAALRAKGLSVDGVLAMSDAELNGCIAKVGFHNNKTRFIKAATAILKDRYAGAVPATAEELCQLPGVRPPLPPYLPSWPGPPNTARQRARRPSSLRAHPTPSARHGRPPLPPRAYGAASARPARRGPVPPSRPTIRRATPPLPLSTTPAHRRGGLMERATTGPRRVQPV
jgi:hypothetical protein